MTIPYLLLSLAVLSAPPADTLQTAAPTMGWSSWNTYRTAISDSLIMAQASAMVSTGLADAGYTYVNIDDGHFGPRTAEGHLTANPIRFPGGLKQVVDHIHSLGLKSGIYSDAGGNTCGSYWDADSAGRGVGLYGHDLDDAHYYFDSLKFDFIKVDFCGGDPRQNSDSLLLDERKRYTEIAEAIASTGRPVRMNICRWAFPGTWAADVAGSWRVSPDINPSWESVRSIINRNLYLSAYASEGHYNDMDMLEVGRGLTPEEDHTHFAMWCMMSSPLLIGCDLTTLSPETLSLLTDSALIALNHRPPYAQARVVSSVGQGKILIKDIDRRMGPSQAVAFYNPTDEEMTLPLDFSAVNLSGPVHVTPLEAGSVHTTASEGMKATVPPHGCRIFIIKGTRLERHSYPAANALLGDYQEISSAPHASLTKDESAPLGLKATGLGGRSDNYIEWPDVETPGGGRRKVTVYTSGTGAPITLNINGEARTILTPDENGTATATVDFPSGICILRLHNPDKPLADILKMTIDKVSLTELPLPQVPASLTTPEERAEYVLAHYWNALDFMDTTLVRSAAFMEPHFATYATLFPIVDKDAAYKAASSLMKRAEADREGYNQLTATIDTYLGESDSPVANTEAYLAFLKAISEAAYLDPTRLSRINALRESLEKNSPGTPAADFHINLRSGESEALMQLVNPQGFTLLLFHDPECSDCSALIKKMSSDPIISDAIDKGALKVIAVNVSGDGDHWIADPYHVPSVWTDTFSPDGEVMNEEIYYLPVLPTLYLLDNSGSVVSRDISGIMDKIYSVIQ